MKQKWSCECLCITATFFGVQKKTQLIEFLFKNTKKNQQTIVNKITLLRDRKTVKGTHKLTKKKIYDVDTKKKNILGKIYKKWSVFLESISH